MCSSILAIQKTLFLTPNDTPDLGSQSGAGDG